MLRALPVPPRGHGPKRDGLGSNRMSQYSHLTADLSNENSSITKVVRLVGHDRTVLDVGCAHGYLGEVLRARGRIASRSSSEMSRSRTGSRSSTGGAST